MGEHYVRQSYDIVPVRPLPVGSKVIYYSREKTLNFEATVKASSLSFLWVVDTDEEHMQHFLVYDYIVEVIEIGTVC